MDELEQLQHLQDVSEQFVKLVKGINAKFDTILDGAKLVTDTSQRWNDVFQLMNSDNVGSNSNTHDRDLLLIEALDEEKTV